MSYYLTELNAAYITVSSSCGKRLISVIKEVVANKYLILYFHEAISVEIRIIRIIEAVRLPISFNLIRI